MIGSIVIARVDGKPPRIAKVVGGGVLTQAVRLRMGSSGGAVRYAFKVWLVPHANILREATPAEIKNGFVKS